LAAQACAQAHAQAHVCPTVPTRKHLLPNTSLKLLGCSKDVSMNAIVLTSVRIRPQANKREKRARDTNTSLDVLQLQQLLQLLQITQNQSDARFRTQVICAIHVEITLQLS
jgi:hypothetical protein